MFLLLQEEPKMHVSSLASPLACTPFQSPPPAPNINSKPNSRNSNMVLDLLGSEVASISALLTLTQQDTEVNAPLQSSSGLLQGQDLVSALDQSMSTYESILW